MTRTELEARLALMGMERYFPPHITDSNRVRYVDKRQLVVFGITDFSVRVFSRGTHIDFTDYDKAWEHIRHDKT